MPFENKELSRAWKIAFIGCFDKFAGQNSVWVAMTEFRLTSPDAKETSVTIIFGRSFVDDFFKVSNIQDISRILEDKEDLFKTWGFVRIEKCLDNDSLKERLEISNGDLKWGKEIVEGRLRPSSIPQDSNTYIYTPERKMGF